MPRGRNRLDLGRPSLGSPRVARVEPRHHPFEACRIAVPLSHVATGSPATALIRSLRHETAARYDGCCRYAFRSEAGTVPMVVRFAAANRVENPARWDSDAGSYARAESPPGTSRPRGQHAFPTPRPSARSGPARSGGAGRTDRRVPGVLTRPPWTFASSAHAGGHIDRYCCATQADVA